jgi:Mycobacterium membrane protein
MVALVAACAAVGLASTPSGGQVRQSAATPSPAAGARVPTDMIGGDAGAAQSELAQLGLQAKLVGEGDVYCQPATPCVVTDVSSEGQTLAPGSDVEVDVTPVVEDTTELATDTTTEAPPAPPAQDVVVYTITGRRSSSITFTNSTGDISQVTDTTHLPWTYKYTSLPEAEGFMDVSAQNAGSGEISCSISVNGQVVKMNTSSGAYAIVDCTSS